MGKIILYGILAERAGNKEIEINTDGRTPLEILEEVASRYNLKDLIFKDKKVRPIYLVMIDGRDYLSLGLLNKPMEGEKEIRLIPVYHGGGKKNPKTILIAVLVVLLFILSILLQFLD
ncbi:MAG: MoaD/ThiS family protein [Candidatus Njordarchaeia archaeon]